MACTGCAGRRTAAAAPVQTTGLEYELQRADGTKESFPTFAEARDARASGEKVFAVRRPV